MVFYAYIVRLATFWPGMDAAAGDNSRHIARGDQGEQEAICNLWILNIIEKNRVLREGSNC